MLLIFLLVLILGITNFVPGTYLTGWDNLHPEFDFAINVKRSLFAVWQEYQGTGLLGGMGHAADLPRQLFLWGVSMFLPDNSLRYFWTMLTLLIGGLGAYYLARDFVIRKSTLLGRLWATLAGIFYILNLSTVQQYYVPFETFTFHFAFLPWILWSVLLYLNKATFKRFCLVSVIFFLSAPSYYVPTLFVVTAIAIAILGLAHFATHRNLYSVKKIFSIFISLFVSNSFWLLPFAYFTLVNSQVVVENKINQMATETIFLENKQHGNLLDVPILKSFWFNKIDPDLSGQFNFLMLPWREHLENPLVLTLGYLLFLGVLFGAYREFKNKRFATLGLLGILSFCFVMLLSSTPPFSWIGEVLRSSVPFFNQAFRFPFTKFSILTSLLYSLFFASGVYLISQLTLFRKWSPVVLAASILAILTYSFPALSGNLIYQKEQIPIPQEYFDTFRFFKENGRNERIANFPQHTFWGWTFYKWGYGGSGFLWYGIDQPILDRAFDPWSKHSENYYWEVSQALYSKDASKLESVFEKYQVSWLLVDENVISPLSPKATYIDELKTLLLQSNKVVSEKEFGNIGIYKVLLTTYPKNFVYALSKKLPSTALFEYESDDLVFSQIGNYKEGTDYYYPFRELFTGRNPLKGIKIREDAYQFIFKVEIPEDIQNKDLKVSDFDNEIVYINSDSLQEITYEKPTIEKSDNTISVSFPKVSGYFSRVLNPTDTEALRACDNPDPKKGQHIAVEKSVLQSFSINNTCRVSFWIPTLSHSLSYLVKAQTRNISGQPHVFWVENPISDRSDQELYLPKSTDFQTSYLVQPPMAFDGIGYTLHFDNRSVGNDRSVNELGAVEIYPFPYKFLKNLLFADNTLAENTEEIGDYIKVEVVHPNQSWYKVKPEKAGTIVLSQAFDRGWVAFKGREKIREHIMVNNWQNGWEVSDNSEITIVYLPQFLQYIGFALIGIGAIVILFKLWNLRFPYKSPAKKR